MASGFDKSTIYTPPSFNVSNITKLGFITNKDLHTLVHKLFNQTEAQVSSFALLNRCRGKVWLHLSVYQTTTPHTGHTIPCPQNKNRIS